MKSIENYKDDFIGWCAECVRISDKLTGAPVPLVLNAPQRRLAELMEEKRRAGLPVRIILLKARQWGGSTVVQAYMAWMQLVVHRSWHSLVCAHQKDAAASLRGMLTMMLRHYPDRMRDDGYNADRRDWELSPYEQTKGVGVIKARDCRIALATAGNPDALRGGAFQMAHLSEAAFWGDGDDRAASAIMRTVCGTVPNRPDTVVVIESTANGPDNFFAREWRRAVAGESDRVPVFVPWHEIELYRRPLTGDAREALAASLDPYESALQADGVSMEAIAWYRDKRREYTTHAEMMAEFPSTPEEAFAVNRREVFGAAEAGALRECGAFCAADSDLMVVVAGKRRLLSWFRISGTDAPALCCGGDRLYEGSLAVFMEDALRPGVPLVIVDSGAGGQAGHGAWCLRRAERSDAVVMLHPVTDAPMVDLTPASLAEMTDLHRELLAAGVIADYHSQARRMLSAYDPQHPERHPYVTARMAASLMLEHRLEESPLSPADFL